MKEEFLHYVWKYQLFSTYTLKTTVNESLIVLKPGIHNNNSGPDFLNAQIKISNQLWVGNVEIHLKSSDWYLHNHEKDENYDAVILHVVWEDDATVFMKNNKPLPVLSLKEFVKETAVKNFKRLFSNQLRWIPCEKDFFSIDSFTINYWKERLFIERLEKKSKEISLLLEANKNDFEAVLFLLLAKNFGLKVNGEAFLNLAKSFQFPVLRKVRFDKVQLSALLFGQAGFFEEIIEDEYFKLLKKEYIFLKRKYDLKSIRKRQFSFFRMRPNNFPTIRIAQLSALYNLHQNLFSKVIKINTLNGFYDLFTVQVDHFWKNHYTFEKESKSSNKKLTKPFIDLLLINTILPLKFLYQKNRGDVNEYAFLEIIQRIKPEKNSIVSKFRNMKVEVESAYDSQSLLELKNNYCAKKHCLQCAIGVKLLSKGC